MTHLPIYEMAWIVHPSFCYSHNQSQQTIFSNFLQFLPNALTLLWKILKYSIFDIQRPNIQMFNI